MSTTPRAALPLLAAAQAQKHVTHNDALCQLDALINAQFLDRDLTAPPASPADGDTYLVKATATGAWTGQDGMIAYCLDGGWQFYEPFAGLIAYVADENALIIYTGSAWADFAAMLALQNLPLLGVNTTADSTNKLAVKSAAVLLDNLGNGVQVKLNKNAAADTASFLYQTGYSGRAEIGLCGDDGFHFKVSPDGASWTEALVIDNTSGLVTLAGDPTADAHAATKKYVDDHAGGGGAPKSVQVFTASGTWTRPTGVTTVIIEAVGGGGSGGSAVANAGAGGGGAGGYSKKLLDVSAISSATVTIGAGGAAAATGSHPGNAGGDSSFGAFCVAKGGSGGSAGASAVAGNSYAGGAGGTVTGAVGDITLAGANGRTGSVQQGTRAAGGDGGGSAFGDGGCGGIYAAAGGNGPVPGAGGGGAGNSANASGGAGADGIVIVWEYA